MRRPSAVLLVCVAACGGVPFLAPDSRTAADQARAVEPRCKGFTEEGAATILSPAIIDSVEPAYSYVNAGLVDRQANLRGARIHVRPLPGLSRESLARGLECHESRAVLGHVGPRADDPYALPDHWLDIDVDSEGDGFVVLVRSDAIVVAREVLERARRFASERPDGG